MKRFFVLFGILNLLIFGEVKKVYLLNISKGEKPDLKLVEKEDLSLLDLYIADFSIVNEKIENRDKWLKVIFSKGTEKNKPYGKCKFGVNKPKINDWSNYEIIKFEVYNPQNNPVKIDFIVREKKHPFSYGERFDTSLIIPPGKSIQKVYIQGATNNNRESFDLKNIYEWFIGVHNLGDTPITLYFGDIELTFDE